jgi:hypothetical protein
MRSFPENFECLGLWEAHFGAPDIAEQTVTIPVKALPIFPPHPLDRNDRVFWQHPALGGVVNGLLVFKGVTLSKRTIYKGRDLPSYVVEDINIRLTGEVLKVYPFEGRLNDRITTDSFGWCLNEQGTVGVDWKIIARSFELQVE